MRIQNIIKNILPSYRVSRNMHKDMEEKFNYLNNKIDELNEKTNYLFFYQQKLESETLLETKKRVFLTLPKASGIRRSIQITNAYILKELKTICDNNNLDLFIIAGTLLGSVRHKNYIPWDDDIDVGMMRDDYLKLLKCINDEDEIEIHNYYQYNDIKNKNWRASKIIKVKLKESEVFYVDLYLFDYFDANEENLSKRVDELLDYKKTFREKLYELYIKKNINLVKQIRPLRHACLDSEVEKLANNLYDCLPWYGKGDYICYSLENPSEYSIEEKQAFVMPKKVAFPLNNNGEFEGYFYKIFNDYDTWLKNLYGDYWKFPLSISQTHSKEFTMNEKDEMIMNKIVRRYFDDNQINALKP